MGEGEIPQRRSTSVIEAAVAAVEVSASDSEERSSPKWRPEEELDPQVTLEVIDSRSALSGAGSDCLSFSHLQSIIRTDFGREKFGAGVEVLWRRIIDDPSALPPEFWRLFLQSNLTAFRRKMQPRMRRNGLKTPPCGRDHAAVATAAGGDQPRGEAIWGRSTREGEAGSATRPNAPRDIKPADPHGLLQHVQRGQTDGGAHGSGHLRAGTYTVCRQRLRREICPRVLPGGLRRYAYDRLLQWGATKRRHGLALFCMPLLPVLERTGEEFDPRGV